MLAVYRGMGSDQPPSDWGVCPVGGGGGGSNPFLISNPRGGGASYILRENQISLVVGGGLDNLQLQSNANYALKFHFYILFPPKSPIFQFLSKRRISDEKLHYPPINHLLFLYGTIGRLYVGGAVYSGCRTKPPGLGIISFRRLKTLKKPQKHLKFFGQNA